MKVLAIDTSTMLGGVAVMDDLLGLVAEVRLNVKSTHSERLMTSIEYILKQSGYTISDMDFFAVAIGPGSFTGLRIGLSTVKGFSYATGKPIVSVPTLEALAYNFPFSRYPVCTMLDARKKEVYAALFEWKGDGFIRLIDETSIKVNRLIEKINETFLTCKVIKENKNNPLLPPFSKGEVGELSDGKIIFTGDGAILYRNEIVDLMGERAIFAPPEKMVPSPANVAYVGLKKALKGEFSEPISLVPFYIRRSEAEIKESASERNE
jgi:tRNA threonylcarbamoyladenosine biosynthesis protein TsaB